MVDNELLNKGILRLHWAEMHTPVLQQIRERFRKEKPLKGLKVSSTTAGKCWQTEVTIPLRSLPMKKVSVGNIVRGIPDGGIEVVFAPGSYPVKSQTLFSPDDSGEEDKCIVYRAEKDGAVR